MVLFPVIRSHLSVAGQYFTVYMSHLALCLSLLIDTWVVSLSWLLWLIHPSCCGWGIGMVLPRSGTLIECPRYHPLLLETDSFRSFGRGLWSGVFPPFLWVAWHSGVDTQWESWLMECEEFCCGGTGGWKPPLLGKARARLCFLREFKELRVVQIKVFSLLLIKDAHVTSKMTLS